MKRLLIPIFIVVVFLAGCTPNQVFVKAVRQHTSVILPEYKAYIQNDDTLSEQSKTIRMESADELTALLAEADDAEK